MTTVEFTAGFEDATNVPASMTHAAATRPRPPIEYPPGWAVMLQVEWDVSNRCVMSYRPGDADDLKAGTEDQKFRHGAPSVRGLTLPPAGPLLASSHPMLRVLTPELQRQLNSGRELLAELRDALTRFNAPEADQAA